MANDFSAWEGIYNIEPYSVPREELLYWKLKTYKYQVFFVKDRIDKGATKIEYCPTQMMLVDYFKKPLKGEVLKIFRDIIMGYKPILLLK